MGNVPGKNYLQRDEIMRSPDPTDEQVETLLGVKLTGGKEQCILAISQIDEVVGEKAKNILARRIGSPYLIFRVSPLF
jgi:hypothetical protein